MRLKAFSFFKIIFISLPFLYSILYAPFGFEDFDTGFIAGLSWQFITGSVPYTEIIYVRPLVSYIFHSLPLLLDQNSGFFIDRCLMYFQIAIYTYLTILLLARDFKYTDKSAYIYFLSSISFILSVHTFPPMGWHTVDGIFFSVIGIYIILTFNRVYIIFFGALFLVLGALSKQPYYLIPIVTLGYMYLQNNFKKFWATFTSIIVIFIGFILYLETIGSLSTFVSLTTGQTSLHDLFSSGIMHYLISIKFVLYVFVPPLIGVIILSKFNSNINLTKFFYFLILWVLAFSLYTYIRNDVFTGPAYGFPEALFIVSIFAILYKLYQTRSMNNSLLLLFLILAWTSSVSWGYNTPVLFMAPMIFLLGSSIYQNFHTNHYTVYAYFLIFFALITFYIGYQNPYNLDHSSKKSDLVYSMNKIYPKLQYIYGDIETYMEYEELKLLISKYGENFTVLPDATLIHYLSNTKNPIGIDWVMNAELNNQNNQIINQLESKRVVVFLKKKKITEDGKFGSKVSVYIQNKWQKTNEGKFFDVYMQKDAMRVK